MECYKTTAKWDEFYDFIRKTFRPDNQHKIGFMRRPTNEEQDIYIKSTDKSMLAVISDAYTLIPSEQPSNFIDSNWRYAANKDLFEAKL
jgi:hypothetical protein